MNWQEFILKLSAEGRGWAHMAMPVLTALIAGWHLPQPSWVKEKSNGIGKPL